MSAARMVIGLAMSCACGLLLGMSVLRRDWLGVILALLICIYVNLAHVKDLRWSAP